MACNCINETSKNTFNHIEGFYKGRKYTINLKKVEVRNVTTNDFNENELKMFGFIDYEYTTEKSSKSRKKSIPLMYTYCPICGNRY